MNLNCYQFVYNISTTPVIFIYYENNIKKSQILNESESIQILPNVKHAYNIEYNIGKLLCVRYNGERSIEWIDDLKASYSINKINNDNSRWY